jgi:RNA polymerase sporulation-specific sigma factor
LPTEILDHIAEVEKENVQMDHGVFFINPLTQVFDNGGSSYMARHKVEICGVDTSKLPVLTNVEMRKLFTELQSGKLEAREKLVNGNLRLVLSVIQRFYNRGESVDDLFQVGCIGLMKSIDNFDLGQNVRFSTYAVPMIIGEIRRYLRDNNPIRVSRSLRDMAYKALQAKERYIAKHSTEPTTAELAKMLDLPVEDVVFAMDAIQDPVSLFEPIYSDGGDPIFIMDQISDDKHKDKDWVDNISLKEAMNKLHDREKRIVAMRFFYGKTQMEVAQEIGISQAQVSRLEKMAIKEMNQDIGP